MCFLGQSGISLGHTCPQVYQPTIFRLFVCKYCTSTESQCCRIGVDSQIKPVRVLPPHSRRAHRRAGLLEQLSSPASRYRYHAPRSPRAFAKARKPPFLAAKTLIGIVALGSRLLFGLVHCQLLLVVHLQFVLALLLLPLGLLHQVLHRPRILPQLPFDLARL